MMPRKTMMMIISIDVYDAYDAKEDDDDDYIDEDVYDAKADDDFIDIDIKSEDECRSSFPKGPAASRGIRLPGGP
jgi:hypothetical protein